MKDFECTLLFPIKYLQVLGQCALIPNGRVKCVRRLVVVNHCIQKTNLWGGDITNVSL